MRQTKLKGVFSPGKGIYTKNLVKGKKVYGEKLVKDGGDEYREWNPLKSKLGAAIVKGATQIGMMEGKTVLYLGAASGTTVSHVSDIIGKDGFVFALDFAPVVVKDLVFLADDRKNLAPILADANRPSTYADKVFSVDTIFMDIAQKDQVGIFLKNVDMFLKKNGTALLAVKARSIDVTKKPKLIFRDVRNELEKRMIIVDYRELAPFEKDHCLFVCKKK